MTEKLENFKKQLDMTKKELRNDPEVVNHFITQLIAVQSIVEDERILYVLEDLLRSVIKTFTTSSVITTFSEIEKIERRVKKVAYDDYISLGFTPDQAIALIVSGKSQVMSIFEKLKA